MEFLHPIHRALHLASPLGRLETHEAHAERAIEIMTPDDAARYRRYLAIARHVIDDEQTGEALQYLAKADHLLDLAMLAPALDRAEAMTGRNRGPNPRTLDRLAFLRSVAAEIGTSKREAVAAHAVASHALRVRKLWQAQGEKAQVKILKFMGNHGFS
jgi:hypothetical protein